MKKIITSLAVFVAVLTLLSGPVLAEEDFFQKADRMRKEGKITEAYRYYGKAIKKDPDNPAIYRARGDLYLTQGITGSAIGDYEKAVKLGDNSPEIWYRLGIAYASYGNTHESLKCLKKALEINSNFVQAHLFAGQVLNKRGKYDEAIKEFKTTISLAPQWPWGYKYLADMYFYKKKDAGLAEKNYRAALQRFGNSISRQMKHHIEGILNLIAIARLARDFKVSHPDDLESFLKAAAGEDLVFYGYYENKVEMYMDDNLFSTLKKIRSALVQAESAGIPERDDYSNFRSYYRLKKEPLITYINTYVENRQKFMHYRGEERQEFSDMVKEAEALIAKHQFLQAINRLNNAIEFASRHRLEVDVDRAKKLISTAELKIKRLPRNKIKDMETARIFYDAITCDEWLSAARKGRLDRKRHVIISGRFQQAVEGIVILKKSSINYDFSLDTAYLDENMNAAGLIFRKRRLFGEGDFIDCIGRFVRTKRFTLVSGAETEIPLFRVVWCEE